MISISIISLSILVFKFVHLTAAIKLESLQLYDRKYYHKEWVFATFKRKQNFLSGVGCTPRFGPSRKPQTIYIAPISQYLYNYSSKNSAQLCCVGGKSKI